MMRQDGRSRRLALAVAGLSLASVAAMLWSSRFGTGNLAWAFTLAASTGFVLTAVAAGAYRTWCGRFILIALAFCWAGDMAGPQSFVVGSVSFLIAHLFFIAAAGCVGIRWQGSAAATPVLLAAALLILRWIYPHAPPAERPLVLGYLLVISAMVAATAGAAGRNRTLFLAAVLFFISDIFVARWKYVGGGFTNALICYPLYYTACLLFALSAPVRREAPGS